MPADLLVAGYLLLAGYQLQSRRNHHVKIANGSMDKQRCHHSLDANQCLSFHVQQAIARYSGGWAFHKSAL
uniref:Uncharacterized protein n=1 Tax=Yersinia enterocolitica TaxID=630 RepID=B0RL02_YEREN|nr:hypothetical protein [Yersinia enterocolitica]